MRFDHVSNFGRHGVPVLRDLFCENTDGKRNSGMCIVTVSKQVEGETGYMPEVVRVEASWLEGFADLVVRQSFASLIRGKSLRVYSG